MKIFEERTISGDISNVWRIATDVAKWPDWDPHEEAGEIHGAFRVGATAMSKPRGGPVARWTLTRVDPPHAWALINPMPIGRLEVECRYEALPGNRVRCEKTMLVSGLILRLLFWLHFEKATRHDMQATWIALERRCRELSAEQT